MKAKIITYCIAHRPAQIRSKLNRELNGYKDVSHGGRYKYKRQGILDCILHRKPAKNIIITPVKPAKLVLQLLEEYGAKIGTIDIQIDRAEFKK
ncbi:hypothetical protein HZC30_06300 [Candidatus Woesearchaeota archaeon]|nr:hypothetical protein [Candidatus Woesearchaeota archaeon]